MVYRLWLWLAKFPDGSRESNFYVISINYIVCIGAAILHSWLLMNANIKTQYERLIWGEKTGKNSKYLHFFSFCMNVDHHHNKFVVGEDIKYVYRSLHFGIN